MKKVLFSLFIAGNCFSQPLKDVSYRSYSDRPHAFIRHNTYTFLASTNFDETGYLHIKGINNDNNVRFDKNDSLYVAQLVAHKFNSIKSFIPSPDKGAFVIEYGSFCGYATPPLLIQTITCTITLSWIRWGIGNLAKQVRRPDLEH